MNGGPGQPGEKPAETQTAALKHGEALADQGHGAFVEIVEGRRRGLRDDPTVNQHSGVAALLHGSLGHAGQWMTVLIERRRITDHEDLGMARDAEILLDAHAARAVHRRLEPFACGRRRDPRRPDHRLARNALARHDDAVGVDVLHTVTQPNLDAKLVQPRPRRRRQAPGERAEDTRSQRPRHLDARGTGAHQHDVNRLR